MNLQRMALCLTAAVVSLSGCHCLPATERYNDTIDRIVDHDGRSMPNNVPRLDVTRWGMWDGPDCCRCRNCN